MAIYHFSNQIISRKKLQNTIAAAAYRSGERLVDERTNEEKFYKRKVKPITHILAPSHAPKWVFDRQQLWNEVEKKEKQWNAQLAREINVALPKELSHEVQEQLAIEFCTEIFVNDGMIADLSIHRDNEENPHFHVMLTIRPFNEDGTWGNKQKKVKEMVNGKQEIKAIHTTDWNSKEKLIYWREQWANYANRFLEKSGFPERITHLSNKNGGIETLPTIHEGFVARQMQSEGKESDRVLINQERKEYNKVVVEIEEAKREKQIKQRNEKFIRRFTPLEKKQLRESAKFLKLFVNHENILKRRTQLDKWQSNLEFRPDSVDKYKMLIRMEKETEILNTAELILENESNRFLNTYYSNFKWDEFSKTHKIEIVDATVSQNKLLDQKEIESMIRGLEKKQIEQDLNSLLNNRTHFILSLQKEMRSVEVEFEHLRVTNGINFADADTIKNISDEVLNKMQLLLNQKNKMKKSLELIKRLYDQQLEQMYPNWDGRHYLTLEQKEFFVMAEEYYEKTITPEDFSTPPRKYTKVDQQKIIFSLYRMNCRDDNSIIQNTHREFLINNYPDFQIDNKSYMNMFYHECIKFSDEIGSDSMGQLHSVVDVKWLDNVEESRYESSNTFTPYANNSQSYFPAGGSDFFSVLESAIREADRKWREDEFEQQHKNKKKKRQRGAER